MPFRKMDGSFGPTAVTMLPILDDNCPQSSFYNENYISSSSNALDNVLKDDEAPNSVSCTTRSDRKNVRVTTMEELLHQRDAQNIEPNGQCALHLACRTHAPPEIVEVFLEADRQNSHHKRSKPSSALWSTDNDGNIPLMTAVQYGCPIETVNALIEAQPSTLNAVNFLGQTPLHLAVEYACQTVVSRTRKGDNSKTGTLVAPRGSHPHQVQHDTNALEIVRLISTKSPQLLESKAYDSTPLHSVIARDGPGQIETLQALLPMLFLDDNEQDHQENTKCKLSQYQCTRCQRRFDKMTPLNLACQPQYYRAELISILIQVCDPMTIIGFPNCDGYVPLQYMCDPLLHFESQISSSSSSLTKVGTKKSTRNTTDPSCLRGGTKPTAAINSKQKAILRQYASAVSFADVNTLLLEMLQAVLNHKNRPNKNDKVTSIITAVAFKQKKAQHALWTYLEQRHFDAPSSSSSSTTTTTSTNSESSLSSLIPATVLKQLPWPLNPKIVFGFMIIFPTNDVLHQPYHLPSRPLCGTMNVTHLATINAIRSYYPRVAATTSLSSYLNSWTTPRNHTTTTYHNTTGTDCVDPDFLCLYIFLLTDYLHYNDSSSSSSTTTENNSSTRENHNLRLSLSSSSPPPPPPLKVATDIITTISIWQSQQLSSTFSESTTTKRFSDYQNENNNIRCILRLVVHIMFAAYYKHLGAYYIHEDDTDTFVCEATPKAGQDTASSPPSLPSPSTSPLLASFTHQTLAHFLLGEEIGEPSDMHTLDGISIMDEKAVKCAIIEFCDDQNESQTLTKALLLPPSIMTLDLFQMVFSTPPLKSILSCIENAILIRQQLCQKRYTTTTTTTTIYPWNISIVSWVLTLTTQAVTCDSVKKQDRQQYQKQINTLLGLLASDGKPTNSTGTSDNMNATIKDKAELFHILEDFEKHFYNEIDFVYESSDEDDTTSELNDHSQEEEGTEKGHIIDPNVLSVHDGMEDSVQASINHIAKGESSDEHALSEDTAQSQKAEEVEGPSNFNRLSENDSLDEDIKVSAAHIEREGRTNAQKPMSVTSNDSHPLVETTRITSPSAPTVPTTVASGTADSPLSQHASRPSRNCQSCSAALEPQWYFCPFCGTADSCRKCGTSIRLGWRFCPCCGLHQ